MPAQTSVGLACSPRKGGNTEILLNRAVETLQSENIATEIFRLADMRYSPCMACGGCNTTGRCVIKDDAGAVYEKILKADILILAAPIFSMGLCAHAKMFIDRAQQFWATRYLLGMPVVEDEQLRRSRRGIFISCAGTNLEGVFDGAIRVVRYFYKMLDIRLEGTRCYPGIDKKGEILSNTGALDQIRDVSLKLASFSPSGREKTGG
ncbi:MAG: flavodoxin family protein [Desulfocucumaceae bacterium]